MTNSFLASGGDNFTTLGQGADRRDTGLDDLSVLMYSSGTTGQPKGVALTLAGTPLESSATSVSGLMMVLFGFGPDGVYLSPAPLYHAAPLRFTMAATALGGTAVVMDRFSPSRLCVQEQIHTIDRYDHYHTGVVFLRDFVPYTKAD